MFNTEAIKQKTMLYVVEIDLLESMIDDLEAESNETTSFDDRHEMIDKIQRVLAITRDDYKQFLQQRITTYLN